MQQPVTFLTGPTPVEPAPRLAAALGLGPDDLLIKRDDLIGLGGGGNKVRKLEITCAKALAEGARTLVTTGAVVLFHEPLSLRKVLGLLIIVLGILIISTEPGRT